MPREKCTAWHLEKYRENILKITGSYPMKTVMSRKQFLNAEVAAQKFSKTLKSKTGEPDGSESERLADPSPIEFWNDTF